MRRSGEGGGGGEGVVVSDGPFPFGQYFTL